MCAEETVGTSEPLGDPKDLGQQTEKANALERFELFLQAQTLGPHLQPPPGVEKFIDESDNSQVPPEPVLEFLRADERLTAVKMAYLAIQQENYEPLKRAVKKYGAELIPSIQLLRQANTYDHGTLVFMTSWVTVQANLGPDDCAEFDDEDVPKAIAKLGPDGT